MELASDSRSGIAVARKRGVGRARRVALKELWLQDAVREGQLTVAKIPSEANMTDCLATPVHQLGMVYENDTFGTDTAGADVLAVICSGRSTPCGPRCDGYGAGPMHAVGPSS